MRRQSYQRGTITRVRRKNRADVWVLRYYEYDLLGERVQRALTLATLEECPTKAAAERKAEPLRRRLNESRERAYFRDLADRYLLKAMPRRADTAATVRTNIARLRERWDDERLDWMCTHPAEIEEWLRSIQSKATRKGAPRPLANATRVSIRARLRRMFKMAMKWQMIPLQNNPISLVELNDLPVELRRVRTRQVLTVAQYEKILSDLPPHVWTMTQIAWYTGMRISEILGLRWESVDLDGGWFHIVRASVRAVIDAPKSVDSIRKVPIAPELGRILRAWLELQPCVEGWLFGNVLTKKPYTSESLRKRWLEPAGEKEGIDRLGWHHFRHSHRALHRQAGTSLEDQRDLFGHSSTAITEKYGRDADPDQDVVLKKANSKVVEIFSVAKRA